MKKLLCMMLCVLCMLMITEAYSESGILAFENSEYSLIPKKSITLKPIAQGIDGKLSFQWESENTEIAKVNKNGKVTGISVGSTQISCTGKAKDGKTYTAKCTIHINQPIERIKAYQKTVALPNYCRFSILELFEIQPLGLENYPLQIMVQGADIVEQFGEEGDEYFTKGIGKVKITLKSNDGSNKKDTVTITVPTFIYSDDSVIIDEKEGKLFWFSGTGAFSMGWDYPKELFEMENLKDEEAKKYDGYMYNMMSEPMYYLLSPKSAGKGNLTLSINGRKYKISVEVTESALPYPPKLANEITKKDIGQPMSLTGTIIKKGGKEKRGNEEYYIVYFKQGESYFSIRSIERPLCTEMNDFTAYGALAEIREYKTETGLKFTCPEIEIKELERKKN